MMRIDAHVVSKRLPDWMDGRAFELRAIREHGPLGLPGYDDAEPARMVVFTRKPAKLAWPRWWHRLGMAIGWRWLAHFRGLDR